MGSQNNETRYVRGGNSDPVHVTNDSLPPLGAGTNTIGFVEQRAYTTTKSGELQGSASALQMPNIICKLVKFKALLSNAGNVYIGASGVTKPDGTTDATTGLELGPGDESGWIPIDNLNRLFRICDNAGDDLTYLAVE